MPADANDWRERVRARLLRHRRAIAVFGFLLLTLTLAMALKDPCEGHSWDNGYPHRHFCYSDILFQYQMYGYHEDRIPYLEHWNEYPALTPFLQYGVALLTDNTHEWWRFHLVFLTYGALVLAACFYFMGYDWRRCAPFILAPTVVISGYVNYDFWTFALLGLAFLFFHRQKWMLAGLFLGLGGAAKLFPALLWPAFALALINRARASGSGWKEKRTYRDALRLVSGTFLGIVPLNVALWFANKENYLKFLQFQRERGNTWESTFWLFNRHFMEDRYGRWLTSDEINTASAIMFLVASVFLLLVALRARETDPYLVSAGIIAAYLLSTKVYSTQHTLWILPLFVVARLPLWLWAALEVADVVAFVWLYQYFTPPPGPAGGGSFDFLAPFEFASLVRLLCLLFTFGLVVYLVASRRRYRSTQAPASAAPEPPLAPGPIVPT